jgi:hypothetical protein
VHRSSATGESLSWHQNALTAELRAQPLFVDGRQHGSYRKSRWVANRQLGSQYLTWAVSALFRSQAGSAEELEKDSTAANSSRTMNTNSMLSGTLMLEICFQSR